MSLAVHCYLNPQARPFVSTVMVPKLAYRSEKRNGGEEPVSKHHIRSGNGRWAGRREVGRLNPRRGTKIQGTNREISEGKTDLRPRSVFFLRGPTRSGERARFVGLFQGCTGLWTAVCSGAAFTSSRPPPPSWNFNFPNFCNDVRT